MTDLKIEKEGDTYNSRLMKKKKEKRSNPTS